MEIIHPRGLAGDEELSKFGKQCANKELFKAAQILYQCMSEVQLNVPSIHMRLFAETLPKP
jgi:hypothetical protein